MKISKYAFMTMVALSLIMTSGCGKDSTESSDVLSGSAVLGPVRAAVVVAYRLNSDGSRGEQLAIGQTDSVGNYSLSGKFGGAVAVVVKGGSYEDEATGTTVTLSEADEMETVLAEGSGQSYVGVNALTTMAAHRVRQRASIGLGEAITQAHAEIASQFALTGVDIVRERPDDFCDSNASINPAQNRAKLGLAMSGYSQMVLDSGLQAQELVKLMRNMSEDLADGTLDGLKNGVALGETLSITPLQAINGWANAQANFLAGPRNRSGMNAAQFGIGQ